MNRRFPTSKPELQRFKLLICHLASQVESSSSHQVGKLSQHLVLPDALFINLTTCSHNASHHIHQSSLQHNCQFTDVSIPHARIVQSHLSEKQKNNQHEQYEPLAFLQKPSLQYLKILQRQSALNIPKHRTLGSCRALTIVMTRISPTPCVDHRNKDYESQHSQHQVCLACLAFQRGPPQ